MPGASCPDQHRPEPSSNASDQPLSTVIESDQLCDTRRLQRLKIMAELTTRRVTAIAIIAGAIAGGVTAAVVTTVMTAERTPADIPYAGNERKQDRCCVPSKKKAWKKKDVPGGQPVLQCRQSDSCNSD
jgi:hypothetical protein